LSIGWEFNRLCAVAGAMKIVGISMIRNDADIVEPFMRHALRILDHLPDERGKNGRQCAKARR